MKELLEEYVFPMGTYCIVCGKYIDKSRKYGLCDHCIKRMIFDCKVLPCSLDFDYALAAMGYGLYERRLIFNLKYDGKTYLARIIAEILYDAIYKMIASGQVCPLIDADVIIPVPIHEKRLAERGFNQSQSIAKHLGKKLSIKVEHGILKRDKETYAQRALSEEERKINMEEAFSVDKNEAYKIKGKKVLLLDDIYTTGATAASCAAALRVYEPEKIYFLSLLFAGNRHHLMVE